MLECDERSMIVKIEIRCSQGLSDGNDGWLWLICVLLKQIMSLPQCMYELHVYVLISCLFFEVPEISESSVLLLKADENITLECNVSFFEQGLDPEDFNFTWFRIEERDFDMIEVSTCWNGSISEISVLDVGLEQVENSLHFAISASQFENGGYIICVANNTDYGICSSNYTIIFGK